MPKTAYQKIAEAHTKKILGDGRLVFELDWVWCHEITTPNAILDMRSRGIETVFNPNKIKAMIDHVNPAKDTASALQGKIMREWSKKNGIEFLEVGRNGICHAVIPEKGWIMPGQIGIMGDSHTCTHSAFGAFTAGVGTTDLENALITGLWICPPQKVIRVNFKGDRPSNVFAKDLVLELIGKIGVKGATNAVLEFGGPVIDAMSVEGRMTISNMAVEAGATSGMMPVDERTIEYLWPALAEKFDSKEEALRELSKWNSDPGAEYAATVEIEVSKMKPATTDEYSPENVKEAKEMAGKKVDQVYIGSCTNGRIEDLRIAAAVFRAEGKKVAENTRCIIVPATQYIYERALKEGLIETFAQAGCFVSGPTCGACLGMSCGVLAPGEVCVSTTNRNFPGRMGKGGMVHLASPATAAVTAIEGKITEPDADSIQKIMAEIASAKSGSDAVVPTSWKEVEFSRPDYAAMLESQSAAGGKDFSGKASYLAEANIDTDQIIPAKYLTETDKTEMGRHCLEDAPISEKERKEIYSSQILVAGENFGCGSSREHAPWALEAAGIRSVIAENFARIFHENMFANGLLCVELKKEEMEELFRKKPRNLKIDWQNGTVDADGKKYGFQLSDYQKELIQSGGSVGYMLKLAAEIK